MKTLSIHRVRNILVLVAMLIISGGAYFTSSIFLKAPKAEAGTTDNISGWAWANTPQSTGSPLTGTEQGIGWISLNSTNETSGPSYGVDVDDSNKGTGGVGFFSGYAYSENIDWISFEQADTATCGATRAQVNWATGKVTGWARAINGSPAPSSGDGCISLSGTSPDYGVTITGSELRGWAFGDTNLGWISFNSKDVVGYTGPPYGGKYSSGGSCTPALVDSGGAWGPCAPSRACTPAEAGTTVTGVDGFKIGGCSPVDGGGTVVVACPGGATLVCPAVPTGTSPKWWKF